MRIFKGIHPSSVSVNASIATSVDTCVGTHCDTLELGEVEGLTDSQASVSYSVTSIDADAVTAAYARCGLSIRDDYV